MIKKIFLAFIILITPVFGQATGHSAVLTWAAPTDAISTTSYNVYRTNNTCPILGTGGLTWTKLTTSSISALTYTDSTITVGNWCYYVTQVQGGVESNPSTTAGGTAKPDTVTFTVTIN